MGVTIYLFVMLGKWLDTTIMQLALGEGRATDPNLQSYPGNLY